MTCIVPSLKDLGRPRCIPNPEAMEVNWREKDEHSPFVNPRNCHYSIVVDKAYVNKSDPGQGTVQYDGPGSTPNARHRALNFQVSAFPITMMQGSHQCLQRTQFCSPLSFLASSLQSASAGIAKRKQSLRPSGRRRVGSD